MSNAKDILKEFQMGGIESIFICFFAYFIMGYLILFAIYENGFINLNLHTQIFLSISISFPIATLSSILLFSVRDKELAEKQNGGFFYRLKIEFLLVSLYYSSTFALFYIVKKSDIFNYNSKLDPGIGLIIIFLFYIFYILYKAGASHDAP